MEKDDPIEMIRRESLAFPATIPMEEHQMVPDGTFIDSHQRFRSNGTRLVQLPDWESQYVGTLETTRNAWLDEKEQASIDRTIKSRLLGLAAAVGVLSAVAFWVAIYLAWTQ